MDTSTHSASVIFENGTIIGALSESPNSEMPEIVIGGSRNSLQTYASHCEDEHPEVAESTALLAAQAPSDTPAEVAAEADVLELQAEFTHFMLNRTNSDSNILESSIYSELQFSPPVGSAFATDLDGAGEGGSSGGPTAQLAGTQTPSINAVTDLLNSSACSRDSSFRHTSGSGSGSGSGTGSGKRSRRKHKSKKCNAANASTRGTTPVALGATAYPPQYTAIFLDPLNQHHHHLSGAAANAMGQIASAAAASPFLNAPVTDASAYLQQQYHFYQQRPLMPGLGHHHHRSLLDATAISLTTDGSSSDTAIVNGNINPTNSGITPPLRMSFRKWFSRPSLPFVIGILALGGVACTLGGIVLGSTGLIEHSTQYLSAALLMIGIGVSLLVISGAIWRLSLPDDTDECPCYRHMETCRNCNSPYCNNRLLPGSYLYPEFQHRPPPPSYLTSLNECAAMSFLFHPATQAQQTAYTTLRMNTPPPLYRSTNSLSVFVPASNSNGTLATSGATNGTTVPAHPSSGSIAQDHNALTTSVQAIVENLALQQAQAQTQTLTQPFAKEFNYLELD